jgi:enolase
MGNTYKCNTKNSSPKNLKELGELFISLSDKYKLIEIEHKHKETDYFQKIIITIDEK